MELIKVKNQNGEKAVNARELHQFLGSKQEFANWIKGRIRDYGFIENEDFVCLTNLSSKGKGGHNKTDYIISLDMAKELSMVERNEKGKMARRYFIEIEKKAKKDAQQAINQKPTPKGIEKIKRERAIVSRVKEDRFELICLIRQYMKRGDMAQVAKELGYNPTTVQDVMLGRQWNESIVKAMHQKVMANKEQCLFDIREMIQELKA